MKAYKLLELIISDHPLYSLVWSKFDGSFYIGGLENYLIKVSLASKTSNWEPEILTSNPIQIEKIAGLLSSLYILYEGNEKDSNTLWMGGAKGALQGFDLPSKKFLKPIPMEGSPIFTLGSNQGKLWVGLGNGKIKILSQYIRERETEFSTLSISQEAIRALIPDKTETHMAVSGKDAFIRIFGIQDPGNIKLIHTLPGHSLPIFTLSYSPDGKYLLSGSRDATIKIWETTYYSLVQNLPAHLFSVNHILFHPTQPYFVSGSMDKSIKIWGSDDFKLYKILNLEKTGGHTSSVNRLEWTPGPDPLLVSIGDDRKMIFWKLDF